MWIQTIFWNLKYHAFFVINIELYLPRLLLFYLNKPPKDYLKFINDGIVKKILTGGAYKKTILTTTHLDDKNEQKNTKFN